MFNTAMYYLGWITLICLCWFCGILIFYFITEWLSDLRWKRKAKTLSHRLYIHNVTMMVIPIDYRKFMISFKREGYEDWIFYITAKSWKEIGAVACQRWGDYLAEREPAIELADADDVDLDELFGESDGLPVEYCGDGIYRAQLRSDDRSATDGGEDLNGETGQTEEELN